MAIDLTLFGRRQLILASAALLSALLPGRAARGLPSAAAAEVVVQRLVERVWQLLAERGDEPDIDREHLLAVLDEGTDLSLLGRLVLGRYWRDASPGQRTEYLQLFRRYMLQTQVSAGQTAKEKAGQRLLPGPVCYQLATIWLALDRSRPQRRRHPWQTASSKPAK
jgi:hypothetical protein